MDEEKELSEKEIKSRVWKIVTESNAAYRRAPEAEKPLLAERLFGFAVIRILELDPSRLVRLKKAAFYSKKTVRELTYLDVEAFRLVWPILLFCNEYYHKAQERTKEKYAALLTRGAIAQIGLLYPDKLRVLEKQPFFSKWVAEIYRERKGMVLTGREVAAHFHVSEAAVSKMAKRVAKAYTHSELFYPFL